MGDVRASSTPESRFDREARCTAIRRSIATFANVLGPDELRVLEAAAERMVRYRAEYGELDIATDPRDFLAEAAAEHQDALFYILVDAIVRKDRRLERLRCEAADELARAQPIEFGLREFVAAAPPPADHESPFDLELGGEGG